MTTQARHDVIVPPSETARVEREERAPAPPPMRARTKLPMLQRIGVPMIAALPVLAIAGVFDEAPVVAERELGALAIHAEIPQRIRQNRVALLHVDLRNDGDEPTSVEVAISPAYLDDCVSIEMVPAPTRAWATRVDRIEPGGRARVTLEYEGEGPGLHEGVLRVRDAAGREARVPLRTFVFP